MIGPLGERLIFAVSQPRAGSTLLQRILAAHPEVFATAEPWVMLHPLYALRPQGHSADYNASWAHDALVDFCESLDGGEQAYVEALRGMGVSLYSSALRRANRGWFLDKTPRYFLIVEQLRRVFPESKVIVLLRNPLAVLASILDTWVKQEWSKLELNRIDLIQAPQLLVRALESTDAGAIVVRYEELVTRPEPVVREICERLGLTYNAQMLNYGKSPKPKGRMGDNVGIARFNRPVSERKDSWIESLSKPCERVLAEAYLDFLGDALLDRLGYPRAELQLLLGSVPIKSGALPSSWEAQVKAFFSGQRQAIPGKTDASAKACGPAATPPDEIKAGPREQPIAKNPTATTPSASETLPRPLISLAQEWVAHADRAFAEGNLTVARDWLERALDADPDHPDLLTALANLEIQLDHADVARTAIEKAMAKRPRNAVLHVLLAQACLKQGQMDEFESALATALMINPNEPAALRLLADLNLQEGRFKDAAQTYHRLLQSSPDQVDLLLPLGVCFFKTGDRESAQMVFERILELDPNHALARDNLKAVTGQEPPKSASRAAELSPAATATRLSDASSVNESFLEAERQFWNVATLEEAMFGRVFTDEKINALSPDERRAAWDRSALSSMNRVLDQLSVSPEWRVLEIGCGVGRILKPMRERFAEVDGVDISDKMISFAQDYLRDCPGQGRVWVNNGHDLAGALDEHYDLVFSMIVFQHIRSVSVVRSYIREVLRVLKPGGCFRLQVHRRAPGMGRFDEEARAGVQYGLQGNSYTEEELRGLLEDAGFVVTELTQQGQWIWATAQRAALTLEIPIVAETALTSAEPPRISVLVSTYKSERFLRGCLDDLVAQTIANQIEIIVVDSASPENERAIVEEFQRLHTNIVYLRTEEREPLYAAWNRGLALARGRYVTNANTDDRHRADAFERLSRALDEHPNVALAYGDCYLSETPNESFEANSRRRSYRYPDYFGPAALLHYQFGPQPMWRREIHQTLGGFDPSFKAAGDYDFNLRFAAHFKALHLSEVLGTYLIHSEAISYADNTMAKDNQRLASLYQQPETIEALYRQAGFPAEKAADKARLFLDLGLRALEFYPPWKEGVAESNVALARRCFEWSIEADPNCAAARNNLGCLLAWMDRAEEALRTIQDYDAWQSHPVLRGNAARLEASRANRKSGPDLDLLPSELALPTQRELSGKDHSTVSASETPSLQQAPTKPMNLCLVASVGVVDPTGPNGGLETAMVQSASALAKRGHRVALVAAKLKQGGHFDGVEFLSLTDWQAGRYPEFSSKADVLAFASGPDLRSYDQVPATVARVILFHHQELQFLTGGDSRALLNERIDRVICVSEAVRANLMRDGVHTKHLIVVPNGIDHSLFHPRDVARQPGRVLYAGALVPDKNPHTLIEAFLAISPRFPEAELHLCGSAALWGMAEYLKPEVIRRLNPKVHFHGIVKPEEMARQYSLATLCVIPSKFESFSLTSLEAQACGCVPLVARTGGLPETLRAGETGFIYEPNTVAGLAAALSKLLSEPDHVLAASYRAPEFVRQTFSWERVAQSYEAVFAEAVQRRKAGVAASGSSVVTSQQQVPLVSVIIPCYKYAHLLIEAVESVLAQTFKDFEIIIVNDGSPDNTVEVANQLIHRHGTLFRIRLIDQPNSGQPAAARNAGIAAAQGEFILPLDADDKIAPTFLDKTVAVLKTAPEIGVAYTHIQHFGTLQSVYRCGAFHAETLARDNVLPYASLYRRRLWEEVGGYRLNVRGYEDWDFWLTLAEKGVSGRLVPEPLFLYRKHGASLLGTANDRRNQLVAQVRCNHPKLYSPNQIEEARKFLATLTHATESCIGAGEASPRLRITYLISSILGVTGGNQTLLGHVNGLVARGHEVTLVTCTPKPAHTPIQARVVQVPKGRRMADCVPESDVVVATYFVNAVELASIKAPVKVYYAQGDQYVFADTALKGGQHEQLRKLSDLSYQMPDVFFLPNSLNLANAVRERTGRLPDAVLPVMVNREVFKPTPRERAPETWRILIVGPDSRGSQAEPLTFKGIGDIREALRLLGQRTANFQVLRMSSTPPDLFADFPCEFHQAPPNALKTRLYGSADILIYASHYDSCPRPPLEAMSAGCAVVCTDTAGAREYCQDGVNCRMVPIQNPQAIADAAWEIMTTDALRQRIVQGGFATAERLDERQEIDVLEKLLLQFRNDAASRKRLIGFDPQRANHPASDAKTIQKSTLKKAAVIELPPCAVVGHLGETRELQRQKKLPNAWNATLAALKVRPFHPEAWLLLAEIAQAAGDHVRAKHCGERARKMAPDWKPAKKFLKSLTAHGPNGKARLQLPELPAPLMASELRLTVCLIVKNEEKFIGRCLESVRKHAQQIVVVDTGSTDWTRQIADRFGAEIYSFTWCDDFSAARNAALERATGDWILFLDADEELRADTVEFLRKEITEARVMAYRLPIFDVGREDEGCSYVPRLYRNAPGLFYVGRVHEQVFSSIEVRRAEWGLENRLGKTSLLHHGYTAAVMKDRDKIQRNLTLLEKAIEELPGEPNLLMNHGLELMRAGQPEAALQQYEAAYDAMAALPSAQVVPELRETLLTQFSRHLLAAKNASRVVDVLQSRLARSAPLTGSMHFTLGLALMELGNYSEAATNFRQCLAKRDLATLSPVNKDIRKGAPSHCLALCLQKLQQPSEAAEAFAAALNADPQSHPVRHDYARFLAATGQPVEALQQFHQLVSDDPNDLAAWFSAGQIALSQPGFVEFASDWTGEAVKHHPVQPQILWQRTEALLRNGECAQALAILRRLPRLAGARQDAARALCELVTGEAWTPFDSSEPVVSQEFLRWYRTLLADNASLVISTVNGRLDRLRDSLPSVSRTLEQALAEAGTEAAVA